MRIAWYGRAVAGAGLTAGIVGAGLTGAAVAGPLPAAGASVPAAAPIVIVPTPAGLATQGGAAVKSSNWSGYDVVGGPFTSVSSSWTQPKATCTATLTYAAFWVGLDGDGSNSVEQTGSDADCHAGTAHYYAWYEMYPRGPVTFSNPVQPGDAFSASVTSTGSGHFTLVITDSTRNWTQTVHATYKPAKLESAEVIAEAPTSTAVLPLTDFGRVSFTSAMVDGVPLGTAGPDRKLVMVTYPGEVVKAQPGPLTGGSAFSITWKHS